MLRTVLNISIEDLERIRREKRVNPVADVARNKSMAVMHVDVNHEQLWAYCEKVQNDPELRALWNFDS